MTETLRVVSYDATMKDVWDAFVSTSRVPHFLFLRDYMDYHADRFRDASILVFDGDRLIALLPANRDGDVIRSHGGLTFGGFVTGGSMTAHAMLELFSTTIRHYRDAGVAGLVYAPVPAIYHVVPAEEDLYALFRLGARLVRRDLSSTIDLARRPRPSKGRRASIKRATRSGLRVERSVDFHAFMDLEAALLAERYGVAPTHTGDELDRLARRFPDSIKLFVALADDDLLAGVVVYETEHVAHTQYIAASDEGRTRGAVDAVVSHLLDDVYTAKRFFDFGISTERDGMVLNAGLVRNKESYGASGVVYDRYELSL
jgi:hypothetical protein